jgi:hypothetical protein
VETAFVSQLTQPRFDLRPGPVHEHEVHAECGEQVEVVREIEETAVGDEVSAESDYESLAAESMDVGGD